MMTGGTENFKDLTLEIGYEYLIEGYGALDKYYVAEITETSYNLSTANQRSFWIKKDDFEYKLKVIENLGKRNYPTYNLTYNYGTTYVCPICNGTGQIPNSNLTSGYVSCQNCCGTGRILNI